MNRCTDAYMWQVKYRDHTWVAEYTHERPDGRGWAEIEQPRVAFIELLPTREGLPEHGVQVPEGAQPVCFRRRQILLDEAAQDMGRRTIHCIGWKHGVVEVYLFVFDNGTALLTSDFQAV